MHIVLRYIQYVYSPILCSAVSESQSTAVAYETVSDVVAGTGPDTSENVAYAVSKDVVTSHNLAYDVVGGQSD